LRRLTGTIGMWENFEYLAAISDDWIRAHPDGNYPASVKRLPPL
jgi:hypothetical protein